MLMFEMRAAGHGLRLTKFPTLIGNTYIGTIDRNLRNKKETYIFLSRDSCMTLGSESRRGSFTYNLPALFP